MRQCKDCGRDATHDQRFCIECGAAIGEPPKTTVNLPPAWVPHISKPDPMINRSIGDRFQISNIVGRGMDGGFYTAIDKQTMERVTVRVFLYGDRISEAAIGPRIRSQVERLRTPSQHNLVHFRQVLREPDLLAVVLDWSGVATLGMYINPPSLHWLETATYQSTQRPMSQRLLCDLLKQVFDCVDGMHRDGQINGYITLNNILVEDETHRSKPRIRLCPIGTKAGDASSHPDRFYYDDHNLTAAADVWYLGNLVRRSEFHPITSVVMDKIAPVIRQATLESRTNRIQTVRELRKRLTPLFRKRWSNKALPEFLHWSVTEFR